jgi:hypothetical protein
MLNPCLIARTRGSSPRSGRAGERAVAFVIRPNPHTTNNSTVVRIARRAFCDGFAITSLINLAQAQTADARVKEILTQRIEVDKQAVGLAAVLAKSPLRTLSN